LTTQIGQPIFGTTPEQRRSNVEVHMASRVHTASLSQTQGRAGWSVIFRHPALREPDGSSRRIRRGMDTRDAIEAERLRGELNELLSDPAWWSLAARAEAATKFDVRVVRAFFDPIEPEKRDPAALREALLPLPSSSNNGYRRVLLLGATGSGKTTLLRQLIGTDPSTERFPSTSTAKTTIHDSEIILTNGPAFRAVVTFISQDELRAYLVECAIAAVLEAHRGGTDAEVRRKILDHVDQRHRFSYTLGRAATVDDDETDEPDSGNIASTAINRPEIAKTEQFLVDAVVVLRRMSQKHVSELRAELSAESVSELRAVDELFEETAETRIETDDEFHALVDGLVDLIEDRFDWVSEGAIRRARSGWPEAWEIQTEDRETLIRAVSPFSSNYAPLFGTLLTPLVTGVRVAGPFGPSWRTGKNPPLVLMDGEGLGHTPQFGTALSTVLARRVDTADVVILVDSASQPMQAAPVAALRELIVRGNVRKLIVAFTHFDRVVGDNLPNRNARQNHVLASAESALVGIGKELGSNAERALRSRLLSACFFFGHLDISLRQASTIEAHTIRALNDLLVAVDRVVEPLELVDSKPVYDRLNFVIAVQAAVRSLLGYWQPILGLAYSKEIAPEHWTRVRALSRRLAHLLADEYDTLRPVADLQKELQKAVFLSLQTPLRWTGREPTDDEKQQKLDKIAEAVSGGLMDLSKRRLWDDRLGNWLDAFEQAGRGSARRRAHIIATDVYEIAAPLPDSAPGKDGNEFLREVLGVAETAASRVGAEFIK